MHPVLFLTVQKYSYIYLFQNPYELHYLNLLNWPEAIVKTPLLSITDHMCVCVCESIKACTRANDLLVMHMF